MESGFNSYDDLQYKKLIQYSTKNTIQEAATAEAAQLLN